MTFGISQFLSLTLGIFIDIYSAALLIIFLIKKKNVSTIPFVAIFFYAFGSVSGYLTNAAPMMGLISKKVNFSEQFLILTAGHVLIHWVLSWIQTILLPRK